MHGKSNGNPGGNGNTNDNGTSASLYENKWSVVSDSIHANDSAHSTVTLENNKLPYWSFYV